ncbi:MAG: DUF6600 domain-containing protein [bacterium]
MFRQSQMSDSTARRMVARLGTCAVAVVALLVAAVADAAVDERTLRLTPPRLALIEGDVSFWRPGAADWEAAQINVPLSPGDSLATRDGHFELQVGSGSYARAGDGTQLRVKSLEPDFLQLELTQGSLVLDLRQLSGGFVVEVDSPSGRFTTTQDGYYRVDVETDSTRLAVRRAGVATLTPSSGQAMTVGTGEAVVVRGGSTGTFEVVAAPAFDEWDRWNYDRAESLLAAPRSYSVASQVYGAEELERYGGWRYANSYGRVWVPYSVPTGWAPYTNGRWLNDPVYGYSWVDNAPWGWAPFHYGRWVYAGYWGWAPGPVVVAPIYSPALVAFYGPSFSINVGFGVPFFGWTALGWGEPLIPWWGPVGFVGSPCWYGWGGPRVVNNIYIHNGDTVNANQVNFYRNANNPGGLVGVPKDRFNGGSVQQARLAALSSQDVKPWRGGALPSAGTRQVGGVTAPAKGPLPISGSKGGAFSSLATQQRAAASVPAAAQANAFSRNPTTMERSRAVGGPPPLANMPKASSSSAFQRLGERSASGASTLNRAASSTTNLQRSGGGGNVGSVPKGASASSPSSVSKGGSVPPFERLRNAASGANGATATNGAATTGTMNNMQRSGRRYASAEPPALQRSAPTADSGSRSTPSWSKGGTTMTAPVRPSYSRPVAPSAPMASAGSMSSNFSRAPASVSRGAMPAQSMPNMVRSSGGGGGARTMGSSGGGARPSGGGGMHNFSR